MSLEEIQEHDTAFALIPLDDITPDAEQPRTSLAAAGPDIQDLADRLWAVGMIQPVVVNPIDNADPTPYRLCVGGRRYQAFLLNRSRAQAEPDSEAALRYSRWTAIPAVVETASAPHLRLLLQISENDDRKPLTLLETAQAYVKARELSGLSGKQFSKVAGIHHTRFSKYKACVDALTDELPAYALKEDLIRDIFAIQLFVKLPPAHQESLIRQAESRELPISRFEMQQALDAIEQAKERARKADAAPKPPKPKAGAPVAQDSISASLADSPAISAEGLSWLVEHLASLNLGSAEPYAKLQATLSNALAQASPLILVREEGFFSAPSAEALPS